MAKLTSDQKETIRDLTAATLQTMLRFKASFDVSDFVREGAGARPRRLEEQLSSGYPLRATGVRVNSRHLRYFDDFLIHENLLSGNEAPALLDDFPQAAVSAAYMFALLEEHGNELAEIATGRTRTKRKAWHSSVYADAGIERHSTLLALRTALADTFGRSMRWIPAIAIQRLIAIKLARNAFAHEAAINLDFNLFFQLTIALVCHLHFLCIPRERQIHVFPFEDIRGFTGWDTFGTHDEQSFAHSCLPQSP